MVPWVQIPPLPQIVDEKKENKNDEEKIELNFSMNVESEDTGYEFEHQFEF